MRSPPWHTPAKDYDYSTSKISTTAWKPCYQRCYHQQPCHCLASGAWLIVLLSLCPLSARLHPRPSCLHHPLWLPLCLIAFDLSCSIPRASSVASRLDYCLGFVSLYSLTPGSSMHMYNLPHCFWRPRGPLIPPLSLLEWPGHMERGHGYTDNATRAAPGLCTIRTGSFSAHGVCADTVNSTPLMVAPLVATRTALSAIETTHASEMPC